MDTPDGRSAPPPDAVLGRGTTLGRYVVQRRIGSGGMGSVYEAHDLDLDRSVAIKLLHPSLCDNPAVRARSKWCSRPSAPPTARG